MRSVQPHFPWEVPVNADALVGGALSVARPAALAGTAPRLDGLPDETVTERYQSLRALVWDRAGGDTSLLDHLHDLEQSPAATPWTRWQTSLFRCGAVDDANVIEAARAVWEALGPNEYSLHLGERPRTWRGFQRGRAWLQVGMLGCVALALAAFAVDDRYGIPWWIWLPAIIGWPYVVWRRFWRSYRRWERIGTKELPHF